MTTRFKLTLRSLEVESDGEEIAFRLERLRVEADGQAVDVERFEHTERVSLPAAPPRTALRPARSRRRTTRGS